VMQSNNAPTQQGFSYTQPHQAAPLHPRQPTNSNVATTAALGGSLFDSFSGATPLSAQSHHSRPPSIRRQASFPPSAPAAAANGWTPSHHMQQGTAYNRLCLLHMPPVATYHHARLLALPVTGTCCLLCCAMWLLVITLL